MESLIAAAGWAEGIAREIKADPYYFLRWQFTLAGVVYIGVLIVAAMLVLAARQRAP